MKNSKISKKAKTFLDGLQKYRDGGMQVPLPEYQDGVLAPMAPDPNWINYDPSLIQGPELFAYPNQNPMSIQPPMAINPPIQNPIPTPKPKPNFNAIPVIGSAITLGMGIKEGVESYQAKKRSDRLRGYFDQDLAERKKDIGLGEYVNTPYSQYQDGGMQLGERVSNFRATDSSQSGTTAGADKMEKAKLSAAQQKENQRILAERKARMERSKAAKGKPISAQQIADESAAIGDKFRVFPDDPNSVVDALNPLVMIGDMAAGLGQVPLNIQEGNYGQAAMNVSMPLLAGALAGGKNAAQLANNLANPLPISSDNFLKNTKRVLNETDIFLDQISGELFRGKANRKAIKKGNEWLEQWVKDPITQKKIEIDLRKLDDIDPEITNPEVLDFINKTNTAIKSQSLNPILNSKEYSLKKQFTDYIDKIKDPRVRDQIHSGNAGVSYTHGFSPIQRENYYNNPQNAFDRFGSWISRSPSISQKGRTSTTIHEGTHDWVSNAALQKSGLKNKVLDIIDPEIADLTTEWSRLRNMGIKPEDTLGYRDSYLGYLGNPTEIHARIMELRNDLDLKPSNLITEEKAKEIIEKVQKGDTPVDPVFFKEVVKNDPKKVASLFNELWTVSPLLLGVGAVGASQEMKEGGIHIDPKNKGKFTAAAKRRGMGVQEFANKVMANKEDHSPLLVKRANFARNAAKWEDGGLYPTVSSDYNTTVELANQRQAQAMDLLQKMQEVEQLHKMMYGGEIEEFKGGGEMIKRADGSYSRRGLWDNIRANRGSGKKPTKEMLKQERKIRREEMEYGGYMPFMDSMDENNQYMDLPEFGNGGYKVERSNDRKGKTHKVTGPDGSVKYFGDPNMGERSKSKYGKEAFYARHKSNLEKNPHFRAYARATWQNGGQVGLEGFGQMYDNQQAYNQQTQQQFEDFYNRLNQQNVANWRNMRTSAINNIVSGVGGLATAGMGLPGMQNGGEYDPTLDVNSTQFDADAFMGREKGQPSELDALIEAEQAKQMQRSETEMELMNFITEGADTGQANYSNLGMFASNPSSGSSSSSLAGAGEFANVIDEIRYRESRGNYGRVNDVSKTTGAYQFMPIWWADQIQDFMGIDPSASQEEVMEAFRTNPQAQDEFMVHVVNNIYKPQLPKLRPYAQKYGLNDEQLIKLMHYRGIGDATKRLKTGDFSVSAEEKAKYNNPDIMEYLKGSIPK